MTLNQSAIVDDRDTRAQMRRDKEENDRNREIMNGYVVENKELKEELIKIRSKEHKSVQQLLQEILGLEHGEDELLEFVAKNIHRQVVDDIKKNALTTSPPNLMESIGEYTHKGYLEARKGWLVQILTKIGNCAPANYVDETSFKLRRQTRLACATAQVYSLIISTYSWTYALGFQVMTRVFSASTFLGDFANEIVAGGVCSKQMANKLDSEAESFREGNVERIKEKHGKDFLMFIADNNVKATYTGEKQARMPGTAVQHPVSIVCNFMAIAVKMDDDEDNTQLDENLAPGSNSWATPQDLNHDLILELNGDERKQFDFVVLKKITEAKDFYEKNKQAIDEAVTSRTKEQEERETRNEEKGIMAAAVAGAVAAEEKDENNNNLESDEDKARTERLKQGGTGRDEELDFERENNSLTFRQYWQFKVCDSCSRNFKITDLVCDQCRDTSGSPHRDDPCLWYNHNYNKLMRLPPRSDYEKEFESQKAYVATQFMPRGNNSTSTSHQLKKPSLKITTEIKNEGRHKFRNKTTENPSERVSIIDKETNERMIVVPCMTEFFNPGASLANKIRVVKICKKLGNVGNERAFIVQSNDLGAQAPSKFRKEGIVQVCGAWHELNCYKTVVCEIVYPLVGKFFTLFLTQGDNDGLRTLIRKGLNYHKCMQYLKEIAQVILVTYWSEFVSQSAWHKHDESNFLEFLQDKRKQDEEHKMYIDIFILKLLPSLFAFELSLRMNDADMRKAARKSLLPFLLSRHRFNYARQIIREHITIEHCAPEVVKLYVNKYAYSYDGDGIDSFIENSNRTKKSCLGQSNSEFAWSISDYVSANIDKVQDMIHKESGVVGTRDDEPHSRILPEKDGDIINCVAMLSADSPLTRARKLIGDEDENFRGVLGENVFRAINSLEKIGRDRIKKVLNAVTFGKASLDDVSIESKLVEVWKFETKGIGEDEDDDAIVPAPAKEIIVEKNNNKKKNKGDDGDDKEEQNEGSKKQKVIGAK